MSPEHFGIVPGGVSPASDLYSLGVIAYNWLAHRLPFDTSDVGTVLYQHAARDRKSTRLNSSHLVISYAVFCLKKKNCETQLVGIFTFAITLSAKSNSVMKLSSCARVRYILRLVAGITRHSTDCASCYLLTARE